MSKPKQSKPKTWKPSPNTNPIVSIRLPQETVDTLDRIAAKWTSALEPGSRPEERADVVRKAIARLITSEGIAAQAPAPDPKPRKAKAPKAAE